MTMDATQMEEHLAAMSPVELENRRREIVTSAAGEYENLSTDMLNELAFITSTLRRRSSGPPKAAKGAAKPKATIDTLLDL